MTKGVVPDEPDDHGKLFTIPPLAVLIHPSRSNRVTESECDNVNACPEFLRRIL